MFELAALGPLWMVETHLPVGLAKAIQLHQGHRIQYLDMQAGISRLAQLYFVVFM